MIFTKTYSKISSALRLIPSRLIAPNKYKLNKIGSTQATINYNSLLSKPHIEDNVRIQALTRLSIILIVIPNFL